MTRADHIRMARVFLHQARATAHRSWKITLLQWAAERRRKAAAVRPEQQLDMFGDSKC